MKNTCYIDPRNREVKFVPEQPISLVPYDKKLWTKLFPRGTKNLSKLQLSNIGLYSIARKEHVVPLLEYLKSWELKKMTVLDGTGGMGGLSLLLAPYVKKVVTVDIRMEHIDIINNNARVMGRDNIQTVHSDLLDILNKGQKKYDFIIVDPPWGGKGYNKKQRLKLGFNNINIWCIVNKHIHKTKAFIIWAPYNFDIQNFIQNIRHNLHILKPLGCKHYWIIVYP